MCPSFSVFDWFFFFYLFCSFFCEWRWVCRKVMKGKNQSLSFSLCVNVFLFFLTFLVRMVHCYVKFKNWDLGTKLRMRKINIIFFFFFFCLIRILFLWNWNLKLGLQCSPVGFWNMGFCFTKVEDIFEPLLFLTRRNKESC